MLISRRLPTLPSLSLTLDGTLLEKVEMFKYHGVLLRDNLSWSDHIAVTCTKAKQVLGLLYRQFYNHASPETLKQLYLSLVRPHLEYAAPLWSPYTQKDIN